jgi:hypothetical protein
VARVAGAGGDGPVEGGASSPDRPTAQGAAGWRGSEGHRSRQGPR